VNLKAILGFQTTPKASNPKSEQAHNEVTHQHPAMDGIKAKEPLKQDKLVRFGGCCG
jgi:hypothetical protein